MPAIWPLLIFLGFCSFSSRQQRRFLVIDEAQFILVEPDTTKLGWGVVKFVARLQVRISSYPHLSFHQIKAKVVLCDKGFLLLLSPLSVTQKRLLREQDCCEEGTKKSRLQIFPVSFLIVFLLPFVFLFSWSKSAAICYREISSLVWYYY